MHINMHIKMAKYAEKNMQIITDDFYSIPERSGCGDKIHCYALTERLNIQYCSGDRQIVYVYVYKISLRKVVDQARHLSCTVRNFSRPPCSRHGVFPFSLVQGL